MQGGVVAYPVMQAYGSLIQRLVKRCWADVIFHVSSPVLSSSQPKKQTHILGGVLLFWERTWRFPLLKKWGSIPGRTNCKSAYIGLE